MEVLQAEAVARDGVAEARSAAEAIGEAARERARHIGLAADRRIAAARAAFSAKTVAEVGALDAQAAALDAACAPEPDEIARVERAVMALAASMTGGQA